VLVLNNENKADTPDFDKVGMWNILVGGTKLSRGYTVDHEVVVAATTSRRDRRLRHEQNGRQ
jgi:hypothetical protein